MVEKKKDPQPPVAPLNKTRLIIFLVGVALLSGLVTYLFIKREVPKEQKVTFNDAGQPLAIPLPPTKKNLQPYQPTEENLYIEKQVFPYISKNQLPIKNCYFGYKGPQKLSPQGGKVTIDFTIGADGSVGKVNIFRTEIKVKEILDCVMQHAQKWKLPPPPEKKPIKLQYPFFFR